jgi:hypothetical protein
MGFLRQHLYGVMQTHKLKSFSRLSEAYRLWWVNNYRDYLEFELRNVLLVSEVEPQVVAEIHRFRNEFGLFIDDLITTQDVIRFKTFGLYKWIYNGLQKKFSSILTREEVVRLGKIIEMTVVVATDCACCLPELTDDISVYNRYAHQLITCLLDRIGDYQMSIHHMKTKFIAATFIQRSWRECVRNPAYLVCRRRLIHEYLGLSRI